MRRRAFTLIELLIVVCILGLLAGLLAPSYIRAKELTRRAICLSNLHHVGIAAMGYSAANNLHLPRGEGYTRNAQGKLDYIWFEVFLPYLGAEHQANDYRDVEIYRCPDYPVPEQTICYVINSWGEGQQDIHVPTPLAWFNSPSETILLADNAYYPSRPIITGLNDPEIRLNDVWKTPHLPRSMDKSLWGRRVANAWHGKGTNCMFANGSAKWMASRDITADMWDGRRP